MKVSIGISSRHIHVTREVLNILYGKDYELKKLKDINQIGQYAAEETVTIKGLNREIKNVRILGPIREYTQVEVACSDAYILGLKPPVRDAGDIKESSPITIIGPLGEVSLKEGCIIASRHIHMDPKVSEKMGFKDGDIVKVKVDGIKGGILDNVSIKVNDAYYYELHLDIDDGNAHLIKQGDIGTIIR